MLENPDTPETAKQTIRKLFDEAPRASRFLVSAFYDLCTERQLGFGAAGRIPHGRIADYGSFYGLRKGRELDTFVRNIMRADAHYTNVIVPRLQKQQQPK